MQRHCLNRCTAGVLKHTLRHGIPCLGGRRFSRQWFKHCTPDSLSAVPSRALPGQLYRDAPTRDNNGNITAICGTCTLLRRGPNGIGGHTTACMHLHALPHGMCTLLRRDPKAIATETPTAPWQHVRSRVKYDSTHRLFQSHHLHRGNSSPWACMPVSTPAGPCTTTRGSTHHPSLHCIHILRHASSSGACLVLICTSQAATARTTQLWRPSFSTQFTPTGPSILRRL